MRIIIMLIVVMMRIIIMLITIIIAMLIPTVCIKIRLKMKLVIIMNICIVRQRPWAQQTDLSEMLLSLGEGTREDLQFGNDLRSPPPLPGTLIADRPQWDARVVGWRHTRRSAAWKCRPSRLVRPSSGACGMTKTSATEKTHPAVRSIYCREGDK